MPPNIISVKWMFHKVTKQYIYSFTTARRSHTNYRNSLLHPTTQKHSLHSRPQILHCYTENLRMFSFYWIRILKMLTYGKGKDIYSKDFFFAHLSSNAILWTWFWHVWKFLLAETLPIRTRFIKKDLLKFNVPFKAHFHT